MAMTKCKECGKEISDKAKACPSCGATRPKKTSLVTWLIAGIMGIGIIGSLSHGGSTRAPTPTPKQDAANAARNARQSLAIAAAQAMRSAMKDPQSFELKSLVVKDDGTGCYTIRARNSFNAMLQSSAVFIPGKTPQMLTEDRDGNRFVKAWNDRCTKAGGEDVTDVAVRLMDR